MVQFVIKTVVHNSSKLKHINLDITATAYKIALIINFIFPEECMTSFLNDLFVRALCHYEMFWLAPVFQISQVTSPPAIRERIVRSM